MYGTGPSPSDAGGLGSFYAGSLAAIPGGIDAYGAGCAIGYVYDYNTTTARNATLGAGGVSFAGSEAPIPFNPAPSGTGGVTCPDVRPGSGGNVVTAADTSVLSSHASPDPDGQLHRRRPERHHQLRPRRPELRQPADGGQHRAGAGASAYLDVRDGGGTTAQTVNGPADPSRQGRPASASAAC